MTLTLCHYFILAVLSVCKMLRFYLAKALLYWRIETRSSSVPTTRWHCVIKHSCVGYIRHRSPSALICLMDSKPLTDFRLYLVKLTRTESCWDNSNANPDDYMNETCSSGLYLIQCGRLKWTIWRAPTNASKWQMGFNPYPANVDNMASSYQC